MNSNRKKIKGLGLCSGGLDSILSGVVLREQGIHVEWISFETPFFAADKARKASAMTGIPLRVQRITPVYLEMLKNPPCGYGKHMNPCLDCHALMFRLAGEVMAKEGFNFLFSGEVLGQRPMSQTRPSLRYVEKHSGYDGYLIRPLSALRLEESVPEREGLVDRKKLLGIAGRGRKDQIRLARHYGIADYPAPAGGCLLTDKGYANRLRDLFRHQEDTPENALELLKYGRHFRLDGHTKIVVGRTKADNERIQRCFNPREDTSLKTIGYPGPTVVMPGGGDEGTVLLAAAICAGYTKAPGDGPVQVKVGAPSGSRTVTVLPIKPGSVSKMLI
ncbi:MAG: tRNA 4-thiouridine(8) synthase ThiI [Deltaproteobacteria bacterium]|nr:tRNA 4-thiouridine(8) synthase ThiI [Deltaproteobacteria bacterium]